MKKSILFISCEEAHHICDKNQYGEATKWEKIKFKLRLSWCRITKAYTNKNNKLTELMIENGKSEPISQSAKEELKSAFEKELAKHNN